MQKANHNHLRCQENIQHSQQDKSLKTSTFSREIYVLFSHYQTNRLTQKTVPSIVYTAQEAHVFSEHLPLQTPSLQILSDLSQ